jgi:hypothetical protein
VDGEEVTTTRVAVTHVKNTLLQGLIAAAVMGASTALLAWLKAGTFSWQILAISVITTALTSAVAYVQHAYVAPYLRISRGTANKEQA